LIAVDSSVAVAAFGEWHDLNAAACSVLDGGAAIPAHALIETYSVLTGFPPPHRAPPGLVDEWLDSRFPSVLASPSPSEQRELVRVMARSGRAGGAIYDALVGMTSKIHGAVLVTADRRAAQTYELIGVEVRWLALTPPAP
jgi:predicted nucleic acid-binding protein